MKINFRDVIKYDKVTKTALSVRDGVLEYYGFELGLEPANKIFKIYRSPATIANVANKMIGIPTTDEHIEVGGFVDDGLSIGSVKTSEMVDAFQDDLDSTLAIKNSLDLKADSLHVLDEGKRELSLGYEAELIEHNKYDFEQINIIPHHLAVVKDGRNGDICSFIDKKGDEMKKKFFDEDGSFNLQEFVEIISALPDAAKKAPVDKLTELMPALRELVTYAVEATGEEIVEETDEVENAAEEVKEVVEEEITDSEEDKDEEGKDDFTDSAKFKDVVNSGIKEGLKIIDKAKLFLPSTYSFTDKDINKIMRDTLATQSKEKFEDGELFIAFKAITPQSKLKNFGDSGADEFEKLKQKEY